MPEKLSNERIRYLLKTWPEFVFDYFYDYYKPKLIRHAEWRTHDPNVAADIAQDAITYLWDRREWLLSQPQIDIEIFLITITRNKAISYFKREQLFDKSKEIDDDFIVPSEDPNTEQDLEERDRNIWDVISKFPKREMECLTLKFKHEMSIDEIAVELGIARKTVEMNITRAYKRMRDHGASFS
jgi:RNA polymerase sigma factor (sigma-70 family)